MRRINKRSQPPVLTQWIATNRNDVNFGYDLLRGATSVIEAVECALVEDQGGVCAYSGQRIGQGGFHVEHLKSQTRCQAEGHPEETVAYGNMVACFPAPGKKSPYGALPKKDWPSHGEDHLFVSPLSACESRFFFGDLGEISAATPNDVAAKTTIDKLKLDNGILEKLRQAAIDGLFLGPRPIKGAVDLRKRIQSLDQKDSDGYLEPFCFALKQVLKRRLAQLEQQATTSSGA